MAAVNVLEAANAAASDGGRDPRGKSLPRKRGDNVAHRGKSLLRNRLRNKEDAAAAAIAASLRAKQLEDGHRHKPKSQSLMRHRNVMPRVLGPLTIITEEPMYRIVTSSLGPITITAGEMSRRIDALKLSTMKRALPRPKCRPPRRFRPTINGLPRSLA